MSPSQLRPPNCPPGLRLRTWKPKTPRDALDSQGNPTNLKESDLERVKDVLAEAYAPSTKITYGIGLHVFHFFCNLKGISEEHRAPTDPTVLASFISTLAGIYGGSTIRNYVYGVRAWHIIHGMKWEVDEREVDALFKAGNKLSPKETRKKEKQAWTLHHLTKICENLKANNPKDAAILACLTTAFWGTARLGEVTVPKLTAFDPSIHVKVSDVRYGVKDRNGLEETVIFIPWTKASREKGENIFWAKQNGVVDPESALANHIRVNNPPEDSHLFSFKYNKELRPMTKHIFLNRINDILKITGIPKLPGHGIRVGSTLEYLLRGIPFEVVKAKGRWQSEAFKGYLRDHAQIMAPYMQAEPRMVEGFITYSMPPVR